jgi:hypothetical protein
MIAFFYQNACKLRLKIGSAFKKFALKKIQICSEVIRGYEFAFPMKSHGLIRPRPGLRLKSEFVPGSNWRLNFYAPEDFFSVPTSFIFSFSKFILIKLLRFFLNVRQNSNWSKKKNSKKIAGCHLQPDRIGSASGFFFAWNKKKFGFFLLGNKSSEVLLGINLWTFFYSKQKKNPRKKKSGIFFSFFIKFYFDFFGLFSFFSLLIFENQNKFALNSRK